MSISILFTCAPGKNRISCKRRVCIGMESSSSAISLQASVSFICKVRIKTSYPTRQDESDNISKVPGTLYMLNKCQQLFVQYKYVIKTANCTPILIFSFTLLVIQLSEFCSIHSCPARDYISHFHVVCDYVMANEM